MMKTAFIITQCAFFLMLLPFIISAKEAVEGLNNVNTYHDSVSANQVQEDFFETSKVSSHPGLFFSADDIQRILKLYQQEDPFLTLAYSQLKAQADAILEASLGHYALDAANLRIPSIHKFAVQLPSLVLMYQLSGEKKYAERAWKQLQLHLQYPDWGAERHFLDTGIASFNFALAYDGLYNYLSLEQKEALRKGALNLALIPGKKQMEQSKWWHTSNHNWNGICNGGLIMAALAMFEEDPIMQSEIIALAVNALPRYFDAFEPDGQSDEGLMYWAYGMMYTTLAIESMERVLGTSYQLTERPGLRKTGWFPVYMSGPVVSLSIGDDPLKKHRNSTFFWFAKHYIDPALAYLQYDLVMENKTMVWHDILYYDPDLIAAAPSAIDMPLDNYVRGIELVSLRENWNKDALYIAMHGGDNNANHGHLDAGTFDIQGMGEVWAYGDLGSDNYTNPGYFSKQTLPAYKDTIVPQDIPGRWHFYRLRAEGKNSLVFNPTVRPDQDPEGTATILDSHSSDSVSFFIADLKDPYNRDVISYKRGIQLNRESRLITVQDEFKARKALDIWWSMHTKAHIEILSNGKKARLKIGDKKLIAQIVAPEQAVFQELPADYLPGQSFPETINSTNLGFRKLALKLENETGGSVKVVFFPEESNQGSPQSIGKVESMEDW